MIYGLGRGNWCKPPVPFTQSQSVRNDPQNAPGRRGSFHWMSVYGNVHRGCIAERHAENCCTLVRLGISHREYSGSVKRYIRHRRLPWWCNGVMAG